jgi:hypothetical protein
MKKLLIISILLAFFNTTQAQGLSANLLYCDTVNRLEDIVFNADGSYYACGYAWGKGINYDSSINGMVAKFSATHQLQWAKQIGGSKKDFLYYIKKLGNDRLIMAGITASNDGDITYAYPNTSEDAWVIITDTNGNMLHGKTWGYGNGTDRPYINLTSDGKVFLVGSTAANYGDFAANGLSFEFMSYVALADSQLNKKWVYMLQSGHETDPKGGALIRNDSLIFCVRTTYDSTGLFTCIPSAGDTRTLHFFSIDTNQNIYKMFWKGDPSGFEGAENIELDSNKNIICNLGTNSTTGELHVATDIPTNYNYQSGYNVLCGMDLSGNILWKRNFGPFGPNVSNNVSYEASRLLINPEDIFLIYSMNGYDDGWIGASIGKGDVWVARFDKLGNFLGKMRLSDIEEDYTKFIKRAPNGNIILGLISYFSSNDNCFNTKPVVTFKLYEITTWPNNNADIINPTKRIQVYPNPADKEVIIEVSEQTIKQNYKLQILDINGKTVFEKKSKALKNAVDVSQFANGVYTIIITQNSNKFTEKLVIH